jgi:hypothetical protein
MCGNVSLNQRVIQTSRGSDGFKSVFYHYYCYFRYPSFVKATYRLTLGFHCGSHFITTVNFQITFTNDLRNTLNLRMLSIRNSLSKSLKNGIYLHTFFALREFTLRIFALCPAINCTRFSLYVLLILL